MEYAIAVCNLLGAIAVDGPSEPLCQAHTAFTQQQIIDPKVTPSPDSTKDFP